MSVTITTTLHPSLKARIQSMDANFPFEDADFFALYESDETVCSAAAFIQESDAAYECYAFTEPKFRRQGFFFELLDSVIDELEEDTDFMFYTNGKDPATLAVLEALESDLVLEEHMMEICLSDWANVTGSRTGNVPNLPFAATSSLGSTLPLVIRTTDFDGTETLTYETPAGVINISVFSSYYYLYGFEICEELRGKGYGTVFLHQVMGNLAERKPMPLRLQVSGDNLPALSLYKKTGFQITETLFGYLY